MEAALTATVPSLAERAATGALRFFGPRVPGWFPLVADRIAPHIAGADGVADVTVLDSRMRLDLSEYMQRRFYFHCYEAGAVAFFRSWLRSGDVAVDVGAHVGLFTLLAARLVGPSGRVHAFEPVPATFDRLQENVAVNRYDWITAMRAAVTDSPGTVSLGLPETRLVGASAADFTVGGPLQTITAPAVTLGECLAGERPIRLLKIDAEGFEPRILRGAQPLFDTTPPDAILFEVNHKRLTQHQSTAAGLIRTVVAAGYDVRALGRDGRPGAPVSLDRVETACRRWEEHGEPRSTLGVGWQTRHTMFDAVALHGGRTG